MNHISITTLEAPELDIYARLSEGQLFHYNEPKEGLFIAESPKVIGRALDAGYEPVSFLMEERHIETEGREILERPVCAGVPVFTAPFDVLTRLTGFKLTRGMLCAVKRKKMPGIEEICAGARRIVILENVENPTNVGAIFRSAAALNMDAVLLTSACSDPLYRRAIRVAMGIDAVLVTPTCCDPLYRRAVRVSMGCVFQVPWTYIPKGDWAENSMETLKKLGFLTAAMALSDRSVSIADPALSQEEKLAIILGTEGDGLAASTIAACDYTVKIPMSHGVDSLNVAAASAVAFWQLGMGNRK